MTFLALLNALPEIIHLIRSMVGQMEKRGGSENFDKKKELKKNLDKIAKAIEENDEKALNDVFNSL